MPERKTDKQTNKQSRKDKLTEKRKVLEKSYS